MAVNMGGATSTSSLSTTPSGSMYDMVGSNAPPVAGSAASNRYGRKRSKSRSTQNDYRMRLTAEQKNEIASKEIDELKAESRRLADESEKDMDHYKAILERADQQIKDIEKEMYEFDRDIRKAGVNPLTKRIKTELLFKFLEDQIKEKDNFIGKLKLKNNGMRKKKHKLMQELKSVRAFLLFFLDTNGMCVWC